MSNGHKAGVFAIRDVLAEAFIAGLHLFPHDAAAVRFFGDIAADPQTTIHRHLGDYELWCLGELTADSLVSAEPRVVITGTQWGAAQAPAGGVKPEDPRQVSLFRKEA